MFLRPLLCLIFMFMLVNIADAAPFAYVTNAGTGVGVDSVSIINTADNSIVKTVPIINPTDSSLPTHPYGVAVTRAGDRVFISNQYSKTISVIDAARTDFAVIKTFALANRPSGLAVNPAGSRLYVALDDSAGLLVLDATTLSDTPVASLTLGNGPQGVVVNTDGSKVYVANSGSGTVSVINGVTQAWIKDVAVGSTPMGLALAGSKLYVANYGDNTVSVINTSSDTLITGANYPINLLSNASPVGVAASLDGTKVYVSRAGVDTIAVISTSSDTVDGSPVITTGQAPWGVSIDPVSGLLYVANSIDQSGSAPGTVTSYNRSTGALSATVQVGKRPQAFGNFIGPMMYPITLSTTGCGTIAPAAGTNGQFLVASGFDQLFTFTPGGSGCAVKSVVVDSVNQGAPATFTFPAVAAAHSLAASFGYPVAITNVSSGGTGTVVSNPAGIACGATCSAVFDPGATIVLTATPDAGSSFGAWTGCPSPSANVCTVSSIAAAQSVTATFVGAPVGGDIKIGSNFPASIQSGYDGLSVSPASISLTTAYSGNEDLVFARADQALSFLLRGGAQDPQHTSYDDLQPSQIHSLTIGGNTGIEIRALIIK